MMRFRWFSLMSVLLLSSLALVPSMAQTGGVVNIYSARHYGAIEDAFNKFTAATGIQVRVSQGSPQALLERLRAEGEYSPADLFLSIDAGAMTLAAEEGLLQAVDSAELTTNIPENLRDPENRWFALSARVRTIVYNPEKVQADEVQRYQDLADPKWKGRLCLRPGAHIYSISLTSSLLFHYGEAETAKIVAGWVANEPTYIDSDTRILETIVAGGCDVGIVNHYYLMRKLAEDPNFPLQLAWANQGEEDFGAFFNVNVVGVTKSALNRDNAVTFLEWMSSAEGQIGTSEGFPGSNYEFPVNPNAEPGELLAGLLLATLGEDGALKFDTEYPLTEYGAYQEPALQLLEAAGYGMSEAQ
jgi:iron(III) transport system substrate-binding protein